jgi:hypothetical protein
VLILVWFCTTWIVLSNDNRSSSIAVSRLNNYKNGIPKK